MNQRIDESIGSIFSGPTSVMQNVRCILEGIRYGSMRTDIEIIEDAAIKYSVSPEEIGVVRGKMGRGLYQEGKMIFDLAFPIIPEGEALGSGAEGEVYCVRNLVSGHLMTVKLTNEKKNGILKVIERALTFRRKIAHLNLGPGMVIYRGKATLHDLAVECADYAQGDNLEDILSNPSKYPDLGSRGKLIIILNIVKALIFMSEKGICHNDFKPSNIIVGEDYEIKFIDYGLMTDFKGNMNIAKWERFLGTALYKAPEDFRTIEKKMSIEAFKKMRMRGLSFPVGLILAIILNYKLIINTNEGEKPYFDDDESYHQFIKNVLTAWKKGEEIRVEKEDPNILETNPKLEVACLKLIRKALKMNYEERIPLEKIAFEIENIIDTYCEEEV